MRGFEIEWPYPANMLAAIDSCLEGFEGGFVLLVLEGESKAGALHVD
jgi:hypothetical protein